MYIYAPKTGETVFPYSVSQLKKANPNTSFPRKITNEFLARYDIYPVEPEAVSSFQKRGGTPVLEGGKWVLKAQDRGIKEVQKELRAKINQIRYSKIYQESVPYTFPGDTEPDGIQMRDERDRQNVQDHILESFVLFSEGSTKTLTFMPVSNNPKTVTPAQGIAMGKFLKARGNRIMEHSWLLKQQIRAAQSLDDIKLIDIKAGWPE